MNLDHWRRIVARFRRPILLAALVTTLVGATLIIADPRGSVLAWFGLPFLIAPAYYADFEHSVDVYSWVVLAPETSAILQLIGVPNTVHAVVGSSAPGLTFTPQRLPLQVTVVISTACSGIYSFGIFASAFAAFALTEYRRLSHRVWITLALGLGASYLANVLRMVVIVLVGY